MGYETTPALLDAFRRVVEMVAPAGLPGVEESTSYGTPALKVKGKLLLRMKDADVLVVMCPSEEKEFLKQAAPEIYFETPHYEGYPAILVRLANIGPEELQDRLEQAWRMQAPKSLLKGRDS